MKAKEYLENVEPLDGEELGDDEAEELLDDEQDESGQSLIYKNRARDLIKSIAEIEEFDIRFSKEGLDRLNESMKFLMAMFTYEIIESLKRKGRRTMKPFFVDEAFSRMLAAADVMGLTIRELQNLMDNLETHNKSTAINKATEYVNLWEQTKKEE